MSGRRPHHSMITPDIAGVAGVMLFALAAPKLFERTAIAIALLVIAVPLILFAVWARDVLLVVGYCLALFVMAPFLIVSVIERLAARLRARQARRG